MKLVTDKFKSPLHQGNSKQWTVAWLVEKLMDIGLDKPIYLCTDGHNLIPVCDDLLMEGDDMAVIGTVKFAEIKEAA